MWQCCPLWHGIIIWVTTSLVHSSKKHQALSTFFCFFPFCSPGVNCQVVVSPCSPNPCENSGTCQESADSEDYTCQCAPGWEGKEDGGTCCACSAGTQPLGHCFASPLGSPSFRGKMHSGYWWVSLQALQKPRSVPQHPGQLPVWVSAWLHWRGLWQQHRRLPVEWVPAHCSVLSSFY